MLTINIKAAHGGKEILKEIDLTDYSAADEIREELADEFPTAYDQEEIDEIQIDVTDWQEIPKEYQDLDEVWDYVTACNKHEKEIVDAAIYCGVSLDDIDEAYQGEYSSDEKFARDVADQLGAIDKNTTWPNNCIDWEYAAKELMYDYTEHDGHYFRLL